MGNRHVPAKSGSVAYSRRSLPTKKGGLFGTDYRMLFPGPFQVLNSRDWLLVVGTRDQIHRFREWVKEVEPENEKKWEVGI